MFTFTKKEAKELAERTNPLPAFRQQVFEKCYHKIRDAAAKGLWKCELAFDDAESQFVPDIFREFGAQGFNLTPTRPLNGEETRLSVTWT